MSAARPPEQNMTSQSRKRRKSARSGLAGWLVIFMFAQVGINLAKQHLCTYSFQRTSAQNCGGNAKEKPASNGAQECAKMDTATKPWQQTHFICKARAYDEGKSYNDAIFPSQD